MAVWWGPQEHKGHGSWCCHATWAQPDSLPPIRCLSDRREMELALAAEREVAKQLKDDKAALQQRLEVQHAELVADKVRELARAQSEKNASLESLVRATAAAAKTSRPW